MRASMVSAQHISQPSRTEPCTAYENHKTTTKPSTQKEGLHLWLCDMCMGLTHTMKLNRNKTTNIGPVVLLYMLLYTHLSQFWTSARIKSVMPIVMPLSIKLAGGAAPMHKKNNLV